MAFRGRAARKGKPRQPDGNELEPKSVLDQTTTVSDSPRNKKRCLTKRWSEPDCLSRLVLAHESRQSAGSLIFDVRQKKNMKPVLRFLRAFALFFGAIMIIAAVVNIIRGNPSMAQYTECLLYTSTILTGLGAVFVYAARGSGEISEDVSHISPEIADEIRMDAKRGNDLGLELFYAGLVSTLIILSLSN
jgi:hypothetical protein